MQETKENLTKSQPSEEEKPTTIQGIVGYFWKKYNEPFPRPDKFTKREVARKMNISSAIVNSHTREVTKDNTIVGQFFKILDLIEKRFPGFIADVFFYYIPQSFLVKKQKDYTLQEADYDLLIDTLNQQEIQEFLFRIHKRHKDFFLERYQERIFTNFSIEQAEGNNLDLIVQQLGEKNTEELFEKMCQEKEFVIYLKKGVELTTPDLKKIRKELGKQNTKALIQYVVQQMLKD